MQSSLLIDIGNSTVKWRYQGEYYCVAVQDFDLNLLPEADKTLAGCVGDASILAGWKNLKFVASQARFKHFISAYKTPSALGVDRFLAMIGCVAQYPDQTILLIDAGSAVTIDLVLANGQHQGGLIAPGLSKLRHSFDQFSSDSLRLTLDGLANNTHGCWEMGTSQMLLSLVNENIERYSEQFGNLQIVLSGGNAKIIALRINHPVEIKPNIVLEGLALYAQSYS